MAASGAGGGLRARLAATRLLGGLLLIAAVWLFAWDYRQMLRQRKRRLLDVTQHHGIAAVSYLAVVMPVGVVAALFGWGSPRLFVTLGLAALVGWLGQSTLGYHYKIVPFLIWQSRYGALVGRQKVPLMRDLVHQRWATISFWLVNGALPLVAADRAARLGHPDPACGGGPWRGTHPGRRERRRHPGATHKAIASPSRPPRSPL